LRSTQPRRMSSSKRQLAISLFTFTVLTLFSLRLQKPLPKVDEKQIGEFIEKYGHNMRTLHEALDGGAKAVEQAISGQINRLSLSEIRHMLMHDVNTAGDASHNIITSHCLNQPEPTPGGRYRARDTLSSEIVSGFVWGELIRAKGKAVYLELAHLFEQFSRVPQIAPAAGLLWEGWAHGHISKGGTFDLTPMFDHKDKKQTKKQIKDVHISFGPLEMRVFSSNELLSVTQTRTKYWIPSSANNPTFDSFFYHQGTGKNTGVGLQMTLSNCHTINPTGLDMLYDHLNADQRSEAQHWFVFVIREGYEFRWPDLSAKQLKKFRFFTMELKLPDGKHLSFTSVHASVADAVFVGADGKIFEGGVGAVGAEPNDQLVLPQDVKTTEDEDRTAVDEECNLEKDVEGDQEGANSGEVGTRDLGSKCVYS
jgi:hypothetical protein